MKTKVSCGSHPMLMFWLGLLTGAIIVGLTFLYRLYAVEVEASVLRVKTTKPAIQTMTTTKAATTSAKSTGISSIQSVPSVNAGDPDPW